MLSADLLLRHVAVFAVAGSGKTVLLRRIIEEAVLVTLEHHHLMPKAGADRPRVKARRIQPLRTGSGREF